jgi:hypothetical protein
MESMHALGVQKLVLSTVVQKVVQVDVLIHLALAKKHLSTSIFLRTL